jgi:hypothetical protein
MACEFVNRIETRWFVTVWLHYGETLAAGPDLCVSFTGWSLTRKLQAFLNNENKHKVTIALLLYMFYVF